ncbi:ABC transporter ATP-binding protein [Demequina sp. NBRC 110056]|uniref:ABC transporter ATP-binding protein n=1 Tax=Demequina sp. NBRC 110056 TaxID=1570345 RepID=UPI000A0127FB|nr:ABC transporter ATP-binding protein [Demequina sp. NBRC 110056]
MSAEERRDAERAGEPMVSVERVSRVFGYGSQQVTALEDVSFDVPRGRLVALVGRSGSGKTSLLNCIGGLDRPTAGRITVDGVEVTALSERRRTGLRRDTVAFVFQTFGLVPMLSAAENVGLPMRLKATRTRDREQRVAELLDLVGLTQHRDQRPGELSGGQQQRVAIARALANEPRLLIADEPTGQLDADTGQAVMALLRDVIAAQGMTALVSTHDQGLMDIADATVRLADGRLVAEDDASFVGTGSRATGSEHQGRVV